MKCNSSMDPSCCGRARPTEIGAHSFLATCLPLVHDVLVVLCDYCFLVGIFRDGAATFVQSLGSLAKVGR